MPEITEVIMEFQRLGLCYYRYIGFRPPKKGEYYKSGAIPAGYIAPNDLTESFDIVKPTFKAITYTTTKKGDPINA